ncbi:hypothetical protein PCANC_14598 [Puccinia coronata f. sp. avenae]|uniref:Uncharacterized protein n=1 Tax=Puccinia coronata f. sp. avenae TaxID=200324 RepID=A0A2N5UG60_9BASI|nr:hypothetical protein PCANC_14598 [Puccinia coronata f. sp. avenae]
MQTQLHKRNVAKQEESQGSAGLVPAGGQLPGHPEECRLDMEQADEALFDSIGMECDSTSNTASLACDPFESLKQSDFRLFDPVDDPHDNREDAIDWDDYLFEGISQLMEEEVDPDVAQMLSNELDNPYVGLTAPLLGKCAPTWPLRGRANGLRDLLVKMDTPSGNPSFGPLFTGDSPERCAPGARVRGARTLARPRGWRRQPYPYVNPHLVFYPEDTHGVNVSSSFQASKWLKDLSPEICPPMAVNNKKHFLIFEPAQLLTGKIVVPIFFTPNPASFMPSVPFQLLKNSLVITSSA